MKTLTKTLGIGGLVLASLVGCGSESQEAQKLSNVREKNYLSSWNELFGAYGLADTNKDGLLEISEEIEAYRKMGYLEQISELDMHKDRAGFQEYIFDPNLRGANQRSYRQDHTLGFFNGRNDTEIFQDDLDRAIKSFKHKSRG